MKKTVTIIDYGVGNLLSVTRAFEHCGATVKLAHDAYDIERASHLILPGVGAFADGMQGLRDRDLVEPIRRYAASGRPLMGICLGMQMLATASEEFGEHEGLNLIPGRVRAIPRVAVDGSALKTPHIGWSPLYKQAQVDWTDTILADTVLESSVYLVHSFAVELDDSADLLSHCVYGGHRISAVIRRNSVVGCQFHPEKSGPVGLKIIAGFLTQDELDRASVT
ncbi:MAG: imidazole glycerol phosphate synthase subunit HisH [Roseateles asaccharophilus]|uniref:Imidazole glycerol phosphate synthase subunit HisH n=1 Tax=Roseateles asaccharophilus TaxID=582607 RepID=A0A4V6PU43_9BURK|nr:imidazole glycerol phosphate synthase subunit HisH [Roseateles asaccharophilus]MDN3545727.1 imidazole glycerol phosphate synthase subunit HisH [Roseateles asaccharophilus]TDP07595.1 glutamine amidotransferase [Roseateles asaccharophilus]